MLEFYEYRPVWIFQKSDPDFYLDVYLGEDIFLYYPDDTPRFFKSNGKIYFTDDNYPERDYRGFTILICDYCQLYIASAELEIGWWATVSFPYPGDEQLFKQAEAFIDSWYYAQPSPGQLALPNLALNAPARMP